MRGTLFTDAEARKDPPQQVITGELASDFVQRLLGAAKLLGDQLASTALLELTTSLVNVAAGTGKGVEVTLAGRDGAGVS